MAVLTGHTPDSGIIALSSSVYSTAPFSVSLWCVLLENLAAHPDGYARLAMQQGAVPAWKLSLVNNGGNQLRFEVITAGGIPVPVNADNFLTINALYHIAATADAGLNMLLYVNGVQQAATTAAASIAPANDAFCIGIDGSAASGGFAGNLDDIRFYTRCLSAPEIDTIAHCQGHDSIMYGLYSRFTMRSN